ncbi:MAG: beta-galactosidase [Oscillospiraceae bacterium]|nr:beta-galactosidase [Oscillospiraceae bacterium]
MIFGVDYYPEHWDKDEWENQARLMREGGFNTVRMGEFAWKLFEKEEGKFDFSFLDKAIEVLSKEGIKVILGTPTAAPPKWLVNKYDVLQRDKYGRKKGWGARRECCANNPDYIAKSEIIVTEMIKHYKDNPNVIAWQIDNEFGCHASTRCYCEHCRKKFGEWLEEKYGSIDNLNEKWGNVFWSLEYDSFDDIILPAYNSCEGTYGDLWSHNPALDLDFRRFSSDSWVKYQNMQIDILRKYTSAPITHNLMGHFSDIDAYDLSRDLDFVSWDNYPDNQWGDSEYEYVSMAHENMRGAKNKNFVVMEEQSGPAGWDILGSTPRPGQLRLWTYQAIAHGGEGIVYFRFRTALFGMEQYWYGVTDHDGVPRRRYYELKRTGEELQKLEKYIIGAENKYDALIVKSYDNSWGHDIKRHAAGYNYENHLYSFYKANADLNITTAVSKGGYDKYKAVYMPAYNIVNDAETAELREYVKNGGTLVLTFRSGTRDEYNRVRPLALPGVFKEMAGIEAVEFDAPRRNVSVRGDVNGTARIWCDIIEPDTAETICVYGGEYYKGKAAVTVNEYGKGRVYYIGCDLDDDAMRGIVSIISKSAGIETIDAPAGVEIINRNGYKIVLNHNENAVCAGVRGRSLISGAEFDGTLEGYGAEFVVPCGL